MTLFNIFLSDTTWDFALEIIIRCVVMYLITQHTTKKRKSLLKQWHNNNFSHEPPLCQTLTDSVKY